MDFRFQVHQGERIGRNFGRWHLWQIFRRERRPVSRIGPKLRRTSYGIDCNLCIFLSLSVVIVRRVARDQDGGNEIRGGKQWRSLRRENIEQCVVGNELLIEMFKSMCKLNVQIEYAELFRRSCFESEVGKLGEIWNNRAESYHQIWGNFWWS